MLSTLEVLIVFVLTPLSTTKRLGAMQKTLMVPAVVWALAATANAASVSASSCSQSDVGSAIASAKPGDTVHVPSGTCSWSGGIAFSGIQVVGAGNSAAGTVITGGRVTMTKDPSYNTRLSGLRFTGTDPHI